MNAERLKQKGYVIVPFKHSDTILRMFGYKYQVLRERKYKYGTTHWTTKAGSDFLELIHDTATVLWGANAHWMPSENAFSNTIAEYMLRTARDLHELPSDRRNEFLRTFEAMHRLGADNDTLLEFISEVLP